MATAKAVSRAAQQKYVQNHVQALIKKGKFGEAILTRMVQERDTQIEALKARLALLGVDPTRISDWERSKRQHTTPHKWPTTYRD